MFSQVTTRGAKQALVGALLAALTAGRTASAQPAPSQEAVAPPAAAESPAPPNPSMPPVEDTPPLSPREAALEARIKQLEAVVGQLSTQMAAPRAGTGPTAPGAQPSGAPSTSGGTTAPRGSAAPDTGTPATAAAPSATGGAAAPGQSLPPNPPPSARFNSPATLDSVRGNVKFGPGFEIRSNDDEYIFQFHDLTQLDYRGYLQGNQSQVKSGFEIPRQWFMFSGRISKPFGYFVSLSNGFDALSILDVFVDVDYDPRFRIRAGRYKTPFTYEFFVEPVQGLVIPERSLFFNNFGQNRDLGVMAFGRIFDKTVDYAVGIFNGNRNGLVPLDNNRHVSAFLNYKPFGDEENTLLENFNIGGSVFAGNQNHSPIPASYRTLVPTAGNAVAGEPFFAYNSNVVASGQEAFWDLHAAWFWRQWEVIGEWGSGFENYALATSPANRTRVPVESFYVQGSYLLTGETRSSIGIVKPDSPFDIRQGKFGTGAIEPFFRYEYLNYSNRVFTSGLADPNNWTNSVYQTHIGFNWHLTQYVKMYFDWNHAVFGEPVVYNTGLRQKTSDLLWVRFQLYF